MGATLGDQFPMPPKDFIRDPVLAERRRASSMSAQQARTRTAHRAMSRYIQDETQNGAELARFALEILRCRRSEKPELAERFGLDEITDALKMELFNWLSDRGFGKPMQAIDITIDDDRQISDEQLIDELLRSFGPEALRSAAERMERVQKLEPGTAPAEGETIQ